MAIYVVGKRIIVNRVIALQAVSAVLPSCPPFLLPLPPANGPKVHAARYTLEYFMRETERRLTSYVLRGASGFARFRMK